MNNFVGKKCPYCKTEFKEDDDIVVCSVCDMPHHKDCWVANQGCTTFGCLGTIKTPDGSPSTVTATTMNFDDPQQTNQTSSVYCTRCGAQNSTSSSFCSKCGSPLAVHQNGEPTPPHYTISNRGSNGNTYTYANQPYQPQNDVYSGQNYHSGNQYGQTTVDSDVQLLIGTKTEYYVPKFTEIKTQNKKNSWNWCSFLFAPYWFIYRKMYGYGAAVLGAVFLLSLINNVVISLLSLGGYIAFGILGNYIYSRELEKKATQLKSMNEPFRTQFISKNGGTNTTATVLVIIGYAILVSIINFS